MRFKGFDLNLLVTLQKLIETESVTATARELNLSQPTISGALQRLRYHFKDELLVATGNRMMATPLALGLMEPLARLLVEADAFLSASRSFDPAQARGQFVIHASDYVATIVLTSALRAVAEAAPHLEVSLLSLADDPWAMLERGMVDLLIMPERFLVDSHPSAFLVEDRYVVAGWAGNPVMAGPIGREVMLASPIVAQRFGSRRRAGGGQYNEHLKARYVEEAKMLVPSYSQIPPLLFESDRLAVMPRLLARHYAETLPLAYQELPQGAFSFSERIQYHQARRHDGGLMWLIGQLQAAAPSQD